MSKKILSLALVVVMLMSMFAFATNAADLTEGQIGLRVESDAYVGMPAGEVVTFKVYYVLPDSTDFDTYRQAIGNIAVAYTDAFAVNTTSTKPADVSDARTWGSFYADVFKSTSAVNMTATVSNGILKKVTGTADEAKGWDAALQVQQLYEGSTYTTTTGYAIDPECEIFTLSFVTTREVTAADSIGLPAGALGQSFFKVNYLNRSTLKTIAYTAANVDLSEATAYPGAAPMEKVTGKIRVNGAGVDLGYIGTSDMAVTVKAVYGGDGKTICRYDVDSAACGIAGVGIEAKVDGVSQTSTASKIYLNGSITDGADSETVQGGFKFLPALTGVDASALTSKIEIRTYVLKTDGSYVYSDWVVLDAQTTYDDAVAAGMADVFA